MELIYRLSVGIITGETMPDAQRRNATKHIDPHVHCRDWNEYSKATIGSVMRIAESQGVAAICDMPNTKPPIIDKDTVERRLNTAKIEGCSNGYYLYIGATRDPDQLREAADVAMHNPRVVGIKLYAGKSTGDLSVLAEEDQRNVYRVLTEAKYNGVLAVHCEEESLGRANLWVPENPSSWNLAKPPEMEIKGVENQIMFARDAGFEGHLHIAHITTPESVEIVDDARKTVRISCGATPHHLTYSTEDMMSFSCMWLKVNPPIREKGMMMRLRQLLRDGKIDWIETDHAPHLRVEKEYDHNRLPDFFKSGIRSLDNYAGFLKSLSDDGFTEEQIERLTYSNIKKVFPKITE